MFFIDKLVIKKNSICKKPNLQVNAVGAKQIIPFNIGSNANRGKVACNNSFTQSLLTLSNDQGAAQRYVCHMN